jgi:hypothetical protein
VSLYDSLLAKNGALRPGAYRHGVVTSTSGPDGAEPASAADLYGLPVDRFTEARNGLVKRLKAAGERDEAARIAKLRRPPATAWALNRVARQRPELIGAVLDAGETLKGAMESTLGGDSSGLRAARLAERDAVAAVVGAAVGHLESAGLAAGEQARQRLGATVRAAVVDGSVAALLRTGELDRDHDLPGFGIDAPEWLPEPAPGGPAPGKRAEPPDQGLPKASLEVAAAPPGPARPEPHSRQTSDGKKVLLDEADRLARLADTLDQAAVEAEAAALRARQAADRAAADAAKASRRADEFGDRGR